MLYCFKPSTQFTSLYLRSSDWIRNHHLSYQDLLWTSPANENVTQQAAQFRSQSPVDAIHSSGFHSSVNGAHGQQTLKISDGQCIVSDASFHLLMVDRIGALLWKKAFLHLFSVLPWKKVVGSLKLMLIPTYPKTLYGILCWDQIYLKSLNWSYTKRLVKKSSLLLLFVSDVYILGRKSFNIPWKDFSLFLIVNYMENVCLDSTVCLVYVRQYRSQKSHKPKSHKHFSNQNIRDLMWQFS